MTTSTTLPRPGRSSVAWRGVRDILPLAVAVVPFGTVVGVAMTETGLTGLPALVGTAAVLAGAAQLAALTVLSTGGGLVAAVLAGVFVNARMLLYSAGMSARFAEQPRWFRWLGPQTMIDQTFLIATEARDLDPRAFRRYWATIGGVIASLWLCAVWAGMMLGSTLPAHSPLEIAAPAVMVALLIPSLTDQRRRRVALVAAAISGSGGLLPGGTAIVVAIVAALLVAGPSAPDVDR